MENEAYYDAYVEDEEYEEDYEEAVELVTTSKRNPGIRILLLRLVNILFPTSPVAKRAVGYLLLAIGLCSFLLAYGRRMGITGRNIVRQICTIFMILKRKIIENRFNFSKRSTIAADPVLNNSRDQLMQISRRFLDVGLAFRNAYEQALSLLRTHQTSLSRLETQLSDMQQQLGNPESRLGDIPWLSKQVEHVGREFAVESEEEMLLRNNVKQSLGVLENYLQLLNQIWAEMQTFASNLVDQS